MNRLRGKKLKKLSRFNRLWIASAILCAITTDVQAQTEIMPCDTPRFLLHLSTGAKAVRGQANTLINGQPMRVYEGQPLEWSHYVVAPLPCETGDEPEFHNGDDVVAGVFSGSERDDTVADLIPAQCSKPIYLLGLNTVTDSDQYRIYAEALRDSRIAPRHGFVRIFGRTPDPVLKGVWPDNTTATLSIWPCVEAFETMYHSDWYQNDILPLRKNAARYRLMVFEPAP